MCVPRKQMNSHAPLARCSLETEMQLWMHTLKMHESGRGQERDGGEKTHLETQASEKKAGRVPSKLKTFESSVHSCSPGATLHS